MSTTKKASRRARGEGTITKVRDGYYVGQLDLGVNPSTGRRQRKKVTGASKREVADKLTALRRAREGGTDVFLSAATVAEVARLWISHGAPTSRGEKSPATLARLSERIERHLIPGIGSVRMSELRHHHVEQWLEAEAVGGRIDPATGKPRGQARETLLDYRKDALQVMTWAKRRGYVERVLEARDIHMPKVAPSREKRTLTHDEARRVLAACESDRLGAYFAMMLHLGVRPQEVDALRWSDLDLDAGVVRIERALQRTTGGRPLGIGAPKTERSSRALAMPQALVSLLRARRAEQAAHRLLAGTYWTDDERWSDLVFTTEVGTPFYSSNLRRAFARIASTAGVGEITPYELRHSTASLFVDRGVPLVQVADLLGHANTRMLDRRYRHRVADVVQIAALIDLTEEAAG